MSGFRKALTLFVTVAVLATVFAAAVPAQAHGPQGCTPGYWKNHLDAWLALAPDSALGGVPATPNTLVGQMFPLPAAYSELADDTLLDALRYGGGPGLIGAAKILLRAAVASRLNEFHPGVEFADGGVVSSVVYHALVTNDRQQILSIATYWDNRNNAGCPLN